MSKTPSWSAGGIGTWFDERRNWERSVIRYAGLYGVVLLRLALGCVFIWFGALKLLGASPVADLVAKATPILPQGLAVLMIGALEVLIGLGLVTGLAPRLTLSLFFALLLGTFSLLITNPALAFEHGNPLRLTVVGEFVCKNVVLLSAGLIVVASLPVADRHGSTGRRLPPAWRASRRQAP